jgi:hypothetical protein
MPADSGGHGLFQLIFSSDFTATNGWEFDLS